MIDDAIGAATPATMVENAQRDAPWWARADLRVLSASDVAAIDARSAALGVDGPTLMAAAGEALARVTAERLRGRPGPILVLAGPGKNGGDGYVAARSLARMGFDVRVYALGRAAAGDAAEARAAWEGEGGETAPIEAAAAALDQDAPAALDQGAPAAGCVDALFGVGLSRPIEGPAAALIDRLNRSSLPVVAADIPSGVHADRGWALGPALRADATVTFIRPKRGHLLSDGALLSGELHICDIGAPEAASAAAATPYAAEIKLDAGATLCGRGLLKSALGAHKYDHGHVAVISGGAGFTGAARLAARAALRAGAGLVTLFAPTDAVAECAAQLTAVMLRPVYGPAALSERLADRRLNAVVYGPGAGLGPRTRETVSVLLGAEGGDGEGDADGRARPARTVILDADALTSWTKPAGGDPDDLFRALKNAKAQQRAPASVVLTPHGGEFRNLFPDLADRMARDADAPLGKLEAVRAAAARAGATVLYKGVDTVVAHPDGRAGIHTAVGPRAVPWLATAGAGDVLAGLIAGLAARGWPAFDAACAGAWLHVSAARVAGPGLIAEDLPEALPSVFRACAEREISFAQAATIR